MNKIIRLVALFDFSYEKGSYYEEYKEGDIYPLKYDSEENLFKASNGFSFSPDEVEKGLLFSPVEPSLFSSLTGKTIEDSTDAQNSRSVIDIRGAFSEKKLIINADFNSFNRGSVLNYLVANNKKPGSYLLPGKYVDSLSLELFYDSMGDSGSVLLRFNSIRDLLFRAGFTNEASTDNDHYLEVCLFEDDSETTISLSSDSMAFVGAVITIENIVSVRRDK